VGITIKKVDYFVYVTGTGCCGFQKSFQILQPLMNIKYKTSPIKYQNSFQLKLSKYDKLRNRQYLKIFKNSSYIHPKILDYTDDLVSNNPNAKIICLKGDKQRTVTDLRLSFGFQNPFRQKSLKLGVGHSRYDIYDFRKYILDLKGSENEFEKYYDFFYEKASSLQIKYPNNFFIVDSSSDENIEIEINKILNLNYGLSRQNRKSIFKPRVVTTALSGGLGNNLFQIAEAFAVAKEFNNSEIRFGQLHFSSENYKYVPKGYEFDKFLGGHIGTVEDLNKTFINLNFKKKIEVNPDTLFISTDMFNFNRVGNIDEIRNLLKVSYDFNENTVAIHLRFGGLAADHHPAEKINIKRYISILNQLSNVSDVLIYSDNNLKAKEFIEQISNAVPQQLTVFSGNLFETFRAAAGCEYQIMHSSTLSFWVALLSPSYNTNKIYLPREFFKKHHLNMIPNFPWQIF